MGRYLSAFCCLLVFGEAGSITSMTETGCKKWTRMALGLLASGIVEHYAFKKDKKESETIRVDFLCERERIKSSIAWAPSAPFQSCQHQLVSAIADGLYSPPKMLKATWHIPYLEETPSQNFTASKTDDLPRPQGSPHTFTWTRSSARPRRRRRPPASAIPSRCPPRCRSCSCSRPWARSRRSRRPSRTRGSTPRGRSGCRGRPSRRACRPR